MNTGKEIILRILIFFGILYTIWIAKVISSFIKYKSDIDATGRKVSIKNFFDVYGYRYGNGFDELMSYLTAVVFTIEILLFLLAPLLRQ